jgi:hypothetical protein
MDPGQAVYTTDEVRLYWMSYLDANESIVRQAVYHRQRAGEENAQPWNGGDQGERKDLCLCLGV